MDLRNSTGGKDVAMHVANFRLTHDKAYIPSNTTRSVS